MVTVIQTKEELTTPINNGVTGGGSCDNERSFQFIKDYQEVILIKINKKNFIFYFRSIFIDHHHVNLYLKIY
jgi:hypothetical protein